MSTPSPLTRLKATRRAMEAAQGTCPHWDLECPNGADHECCWDLAETTEKFTQALQAWRASEGH